LNGSRFSLVILHGNGSGIMAEPRAKSPSSAPTCRMTSPSNVGDTSLQSVRHQPKAPSYGLISWENLRSSRFQRKIEHSLIITSIISRLTECSLPIHLKHSLNIFPVHGHVKNSQALTQKRMENVETVSLELAKDITRVRRRLSVIVRRD